MTDRHITRRRLLRVGAFGAAGLALGGCQQFDFLADRQNPWRQALIGANRLTYMAQRLVLGRDVLAPEFSASEIRQPQRPNGSTDPGSEDYLALAQNDFADYRLEVKGLVERPRSYSLAELHNMPSRTQITRHDCVEGWSVIAKWQGTPLRPVLDDVGLKPAARYVLFRCFDALSQGLSGPDFYYESIDLIDARHPQTILAYALNDKLLPTSSGAPLRMRVERQLGYKMAKYIRSIEVVSSFVDVFGGKGGYWEDRGYEWYAGV
jgi:DMSO/TMAO reductase YedYZ molybdopterin-dependent catalytic subunit